MMRLPAESDVHALLELGLAHVPDGDSEQMARLLGVRAGWPFSFPGSDLGDPGSFERAGIEAAEMALRLRMPNLASGVLDNAASGWAAQGNYARTLAVWQRRGEVDHVVTEAFEIGDFWAMGAWMFFELADYPSALRAVADGEDAVAGLAGDNIHVHLDAWKVAILHRVGRWDEALESFARVRDLLDERRERPPYFASHAYGAAAQIHTRRGDLVESDQLAQILAALVTGAPGATGRVYPWLLRLLLLRGDLDAARSLERPSVWRVHAGDAFESESELLWVMRDDERATALVREMRAHARGRGPRASLRSPTASPGGWRLPKETTCRRSHSSRARSACSRGSELPGNEPRRSWTSAVRRMRPAIARGARASWTDARATFERLGAVHDLANADALLGA